MLQDVPAMVNDYFSALGLRVESDSLKPDYFRLVKLSPAVKNQPMLKATEEAQTNEGTFLSRKT